jgi:hypothetical protein
MEHVKLVRIFCFHVVDGFVVAWDALGGVEIKRGASGSCIKMCSLGREGHL